MSPFGSNTPLHLAAEHVRPALVKILLDHGANPNTIGEMDGTPLHMVLFHTLRVDTAHIETIKLLLDCGADIDALVEEVAGTAVSY
jgi:ankyrin repeat protein